MAPKTRKILLHVDNAPGWPSAVWCIADGLGYATTHARGPESAREIIQSSNISVYLLGDDANPNAKDGAKMEDVFKLHNLILSLYDNAQNVAVLTDRQNRREEYRTRGIVVFERNSKGKEALRAYLESLK